jgi:hypothetical protein
MPSQIGKEWEEALPPSTPSAHHDLRRRMYERLVAAGKQGESDPSSFRDMLYAHFEKLPYSYLIDFGVDKAEDVLLHRRVLDEAANSNRPVFEARFLEVPAQIFAAHFIPKLASKFLPNPI